jgi:uncharacterized membrane protein YdjX (TVP38/TMEM64 family)
MLGSETLLPAGHSPAVSLACIVLYTAACAVFLPLPSEAPMFLFPELSRVAVLLACAAGKGAGSAVVFASGRRLSRSAFFTAALGRLGIARIWARLVRWSGRIVATYGLPGFVVLQSVPGMPMRAPIYAVSLLGVAIAPFAIAVGVGTLLRNTLVYAFGMGLLRLLGVTT